MARILIAGCGDIGTTLGLSLSTQGHTVWGLKRHPDPLPSPLQTIAADLTDPNSLHALPPDMDFVVYSAAASGFSEARYRDAYVNGVYNLLEVLHHTHQHPKRILFTSSTSVYGQNQGEWVDEDSPAEANSFSGRCIREGEQLLWDSPWLAISVRFGGIYGPGRTRLIDSVREGSATRTIGQPVYTNRIHRDDCARVLQHVMTLPDPEPLYIAVDDDPAPLDDVLCWLAAQLGVSAPPLVEQTPLKPGSERRGNAALRQRANKRCCNARLRASGFQFRYPGYRDGYGELLP
ncbi:MAG: NAD(P)-dependent oxidoreductase [Candidatus Contendobacter odensis]|uniref:NAD(P)-dependent oxidoreductase n=1 Tax=Candidatus Contendibacter odensensis TaxID=1400860 RepID=A0A2G6PG96_9GAMM|nr:MAG: NAD(P)-dependent oxidoreductase [Candidatus Contendobacter odensis]